jgi:pyrroline-5-carboxylate reductase
MTEIHGAARLGFLGTGTITSALVAGFCSEPAPPYSVCVSPRNQQIAARLASTFSQVEVAVSNQALLDCSDIVFLAVRPQIAHDVLAGLKFRPDHYVISLIATFSRDEIARLVKPANKVTCAVPMPTVAAHLGPTAIYPPDPVAAALFGHLGVAVEVSTESEFQALVATTAAMASYYTLLDTLCLWLSGHGVSASMGHQYISMMFYGLSQVTQRSASSFAELAGEFKTKGGLNEQLAEELVRKGTFASYSAALDAVLARVEKKKEPHRREK